MNCPICSSQMIKAQATNFGPEYDYCRTCKKELSEMGRPTGLPACAFGCNEVVISSRCDIHGAGPVPEQSAPQVTHSPTPGSCYNTPNGPVHRWTMTQPGSRCGCHAFERDIAGMPVRVRAASPALAAPFNMSSGYTAGRFSSKTPNVSNLPKSDPYCLDPSDPAYIPPPGAFLTAGANLTEETLRKARRDIKANVIAWDDTKSLYEIFVQREQEYARVAAEKTAAWLEQGGWVRDQGYWAPTKDGKVCFYHMQKIEDAVAMEQWRRIGLDNHKAHMAVDRYSWEDEAAANRRCKPAIRNTIQQVARADYQLKKARRFAEAYSVGPSKLRQVFGVHDETTFVMDTEGSFDLKTLCKAMGGKWKSHQVVTIDDFKNIDYGNLEERMLSIDLETGGNENGTDDNE